ncbi:MAG TPA: hypothetical protein VFT43_08215 [Candidatus Polarisedimenticolia bacterium]|nr:hypothetical protein [Candidatus Polarisedimenticolia bacterium]
MRRSVALMPLLILFPALAADRPWPAKGDSVYVAASLKGIQNPRLVSGASLKYDMPACARLTVTKADPKKLAWVVADPLGNNERLEGAWTAWMFKTEAECKTQTSARGEPRVTQSGATYQIVGGE